MNNLIVEKTSPVTPYVNFNAETGICEIEGQSYIANTYAFYEPLYSWLEEFVTVSNSSHKDVDFNLKITYFNTSSSKCILEMLRILRKHRDKGGNLRVNWYLSRQDEDLEDEVQYFAVAAGLDIQLNWLEN